MDIDLVPASVLSGLGIMLVAALLTTALMGSIPVGNAVLGAAINDPSTGVGQPQVLAILCVVISAGFCDSPAASTPGLDSSSTEVRDTIQPLDRPPERSTAAIQTAAAEASTAAFHLAMLASGGLLGLGALVNALGLRREEGASPAAGADPGVEAPSEPA